jgi:hypothetical protein
MPDIMVPVRDILEVGSSYSYADGNKAHPQQDKRDKRIQNVRLVCSHKSPNVGISRELRSTGPRPANKKSDAENSLT